MECGFQLDQPYPKQGNKGSVQGGGDTLRSATSADAVQLQGQKGRYRDLVAERLTLVCFISLFFHTRSGEGGEGKIIIKRSAGFICSRTAIHTDPVGSYYNTRRWPGVNNELEPVVIHLSATVPGGTTPAVLEESLTLLLGDPTLVEPLERMGRKRQRLLLLLLLLLRIVQSTAQRPEPSRKRGRPMKGSAYLSRPLHSQARGRLGSNSGSSWGPSYLMGETW